MSRALHLAMLIEGVNGSNCMERKRTVLKKHKAGRMEASVRKLKAAYETLETDIKSMKADCYSLMQAQEDAARAVVKEEFSGMEDRKSEMRSRGKNFKGKCHCCGQTGHREKNCFRRKRETPKLRTEVLRGDSRQQQESICFEGRPRQPKQRRRD
jgi:outer membrane murein-binding lipoprotein Lpp